MPPHRARSAGRPGAETVAVTLKRPAGAAETTMDAIGSEGFLLPDRLRVLKQDIVMEGEGQADEVAKKGSRPRSDRGGARDPAPPPGKRRRATRASAIVIAEAVPCQATPAPTRPPSAETAPRVAGTPAAPASPAQEPPEDEATWTESMPPPQSTLAHRRWPPQLALTSAAAETRMEVGHGEPALDATTAGAPDRDAHVHGPQGLGDTSCVEKPPPPSAAAGHRPTSHGLRRPSRVPSQPSASPAPAARRAGREAESDGDGAAASAAPGTAAAEGPQPPEEMSDGGEMDPPLSNYEQDQWCCYCGDDLEPGDDLHAIEGLPAHARCQHTYNLFLNALSPGSRPRAMAQVLGQPSRWRRRMCAFEERRLPRHLRDPAEGVFIITFRRPPGAAPNARVRVV